MKANINNSTPPTSVKVRENYFSLDGLLKVIMKI